MSLRDTDEILISPEAVAYIEKCEYLEGGNLAKFEIVEHFFDWLREQPGTYQVNFLRKALRG